MTFLEANLPAGSGLIEAIRYSRELNSLIRWADIESSFPVQSLDSSNKAEAVVGDFEPHPQQFTGAETFELLLKDLETVGSEIEVAPSSAECNQQVVQVLLTALQKRPEVACKFYCGLKGWPEALERPNSVQVLTPSQWRYKADPSVSLVLDRTLFYHVGGGFLAGSVTEVGLRRLKPS